MFNRGCFLFQFFVMELRKKNVFFLVLPTTLVSCIQMGVIVKIVGLKRKIVNKKIKLKKLIFKRHKKTSS